MKTKSKAAKFFTATAWLTFIGALVVLAFVGVKFYSKNASATEVATKAAAVVSKEVAVAEKEDLEADLAADLGFNVHEPTDEEKALAESEGGNFLLLSQISPEEAAAEATDFALGEVSQTMLDEVMAKISREPDFSSLATNLKGEDVARNRKRAAKERGLVDYEISTALGFPFESDKDDEEALWEEVRDHTRNMVWLAAQIRLDGRCQVLDTTYRKIVGNEFFDKFVLEWAKAYTADKSSFKELLKNEKGYEDLADYDDYDKIPGKGGDGYQHWLVCVEKDKNGKGVYELTDSARTYGAMYILWLGHLGHNGGHIGYNGVKEWQTVEKSYLGDDFASNPVMAYAFFTEDPSMQTNLPSLVFCPYDKNGRRIGEYFGINYVTTDAERYLREGRAKAGGSSSDTNINVGGKEIKVVSLDPPRPSGGMTGKTTPTPTPTTNPTPTPTPGPKKTVSKHKEKSSVSKPENLIDGKNPIGQGTDAFQPTKPAEPASTVAEAQHQPTAETQAVLNNGGQKTTPGKEGPDLPAAGSTTQPSSGSGGESVYTETPGGVTVEDH